jgi:hypothetical protein
MSGLFAHAEHRRDLGPAVGSRLRDLVGQAQIAGRNGMQRLADRAKVFCAGFGRPNRHGIQRIEPRLGVG